MPPSMRTRQALSELIEGRLASPDGPAELVKLATRADRGGSAAGGVPGRARRDDYERGAEPGREERNGMRPGRLKTAED